MRRFIDVKIAKSLLFLFLIPLVWGNIENAIICIEENGQVAIESPLNGSCGADALSGYANEHCSRCTDIPISCSAEVNSFNSSPKIKNTIAIANVRSFSHDKPSLILRNYQNLSESTLFPSDALNSVIIRI